MYEHKKLCHVAIIGDRILTDLLASMLCSTSFIYIEEPISTKHENIIIKSIVRPLETLIFRFLKTIGYFQDIE